MRALATAGAQMGAGLLLARTLREARTGDAIIEDVMPRQVGVIIFTTIFTIYDSNALTLKTMQRLLRMRCRGRSVGCDYQPRTALYLFLVCMDVMLRQVGVTYGE